MLPSLYIQGFRCFRELTIERLGRVNLVVGKNNVGKTTLLDALRLHAAGEVAMFELQQILEKRGEILRSQKGAAASPRVVDWLRTFHDPSGETPSAVISSQLSQRAGVARLLLQAQVHASMRGWGELSAQAIEYSYGTRKVWVRFGQPADAPNGSARIAIPYQFIPSSGLPAHESSRLWDGIVLTEHEETCLQALRIIEPDIQRVALLDVPGREGGVERAPHVSRASRRQPEPLSSLGEGMNRLFDITLGMVNARGGRLLIDEIENGLHYSIQETLWRYVFQVAGMLDVQVFATTHSWDCIEAFQAAAGEHAAEGVLVRLERREDETRAFVFDEEELAVVTKQGVEVR
jgi:hypothetical protein